MMNSHTILFDLDGTLLDTAPDMVYALNQLRLKHQLPELPFSAIRPFVSHGGRAIVKAGFNLDDSHPDIQVLIDEYLALYQQHATMSTCLFPGMDKVLDYIEQAHIPWGIVTNKPTRFTFDILKNLDLEIRTACVVCGDTLAKRKPDPEPLLHACDLLQKSPNHCLYIGDSIVDVTASKAAGTKSLVALYGYIGNGEDPFAWQADGYVRDPIDIISWLKEHPHW